MLSEPVCCRLSATRLDTASIHPSEENDLKIRKAKRTGTKKELHAFLGLTVLYRKYLPDYAAIALPLTDLTNKRLPNKLEWKEAQDRAYLALKTALYYSRPVLKLPGHDRRFSL